MWIAESYQPQKDRPAFWQDEKGMVYLLLKLRLALPCALDMRGKTDRVGIRAAQQDTHALALPLFAERAEQRGGRRGAGPFDA